MLAFEPIPFVFELLKNNLSKFSHVDAVNMALSNKQSMAQIHISPNGNLGSSSLMPRSNNTIGIEIKLDIGDYVLTNYLQEGLQLDFIKMDVEGHEYEAIAGLAKTIHAHQPLLLLEWKSKNVTKQFQAERLFETLFDGYRLYSLSYTASKKVHSNSLIGIIKRQYYKYFDATWCLSNFLPNKAYSNVYFVPPRYQAIFQQLKYLQP